MFAIGRHDSTMKAVRPSIGRHRPNKKAAQRPPRPREETNEQFCFSRATRSILGTLCLPEMNKTGLEAVWPEVFTEKLVKLFHNSTNI
jgi:hypothetical protein